MITTTAKFGSVDRSRRQLNPKFADLEEEVLRMRDACLEALHDPDVQGVRKTYALMCY